MANITGVNPPVQDDIDYVDKILASFNAIDAHDHSSGKGLQIDSAGLATNSVTGVQLDSGAVLDVHVNASAAIAYSKLALADSIVNADINSAAAIAYSKLNLTGSIVNADVDAAAAIVGTKIDPDFGAQVVETTGKVQGGEGLVGGTSINASAILQADSTSRGFLPPRMTEAQRDAIGTPASGLSVYNTDTNQLNIYNGTGWGSVGGGTAVDTFTGTTLTLTADSTQKFRYTGGSAQSLATLTFADLPDGGRLIITGSSDTNTLTIPDTLSNVYMNGPKILYNHSNIAFIKDGTDLILEGL